MPQNTNAASRVHDTLVAASKQNGGHPVVVAWAKAFGIEAEHAIHRDPEVIRMLGLFNEQLGRIEAQMRATDYSPPLYREPLHVARELVPLDKMGASWEAYRSRISRELLLLFRFISEVLPQEEPPVEEEEIEALRETLDKYEEQVASSDLPDHLKAFIQSQIEIIRRAIWEHHVTGRRAFERAIFETTPEIRSNKDVLAEHADKPEVRQLAVLWEQVSRFAGHAGTLSNLLSAFNSAADIVRQIGS